MMGMASAFSPCQDPPKPRSRKCSIASCSVCVACSALEPCELLRRLAALVPPPRSHLVRYHGVFGPASAWRSQIVPRPQESTPGPCPAANTAPPPPEATARRETSRIPWAELLLRVFREDVLVCPCGGRRVVLAFITEKKVVKEILEHLGLPPTGPPIAPARITAAGEDAPWQDEVPELHAEALRAAGALRLGLTVERVRWRRV